MDGASREDEGECECESSRNVPAPVPDGVMVPPRLSAPKPLEDLSELGVPEPIGPTPKVGLSGEGGSPLVVRPRSAQMDLTSPKRDGAGTERE